MFINRIIGLLMIVSTQAILVGAQTPTTQADKGAESGGYFLPLIMFLIAASAFGAAYYFWRKNKSAIERSNYNYKTHLKNYNKSDSYDIGGVDANKELEWLRKAKKGTPGTDRRKGHVGGTSRRSPMSSAVPVSESLDLDTRSFQEKMRKLQYSQLPINSFSELSAVKLYEPLPISDDRAVLDAIEQVNDEYEDDEAIREIAFRILTQFRTRNSVEALSQIALYDLSSNLRSKAVATLTDFDHESVFETILLACADPTREVRAAAARGLFRLNFDRANAWKRIIETNDEFRMSHAARAALEAGIVVKSFDRLVHDDMKVAYEAFCLVCLLVTSGETDAIFEAIRTHKDERVRFALLHVLKVIRDERTLEELNRMRLEPSMPTDVADKIRETVERFEMAVA